VLTAARHTYFDRMRSRGLTLALAVLVLGAIGIFFFLNR
jgi:hypothetical protein